MPSFSSSIVVISAFKSLSSASRTGTPFKETALGCCFAFGEAGTASVQASGSSTVNVVPTPCLLSTVIVPPISST